MDMRSVQRLALIVFALFPLLWGFLGLLNDVTDFNDTVKNAVDPMIEMSDTYNNPLQTSRAIRQAWAGPVGLVGIIAVETLAGIFGLIGFIMMVTRFRAPIAAFERGKAFTLLGLLFAVLIWGIGFMVIAGDYFLAWEAKTDPLSTQLGGMIYFLPNALGVIIFMLHRES